jgi:hypothetical protein
VIGQFNADCFVIFCGQEYQREPALFVVKATHFLQAELVAKKSSDASTSVTRTIVCRYFICLLP